MVAFALSSSRGQAPPSPASKPPVAVPVAPDAAERHTSKGPDVAKFSPLEREMYADARRGADWLCRASRPDGRFSNGLIPGLKTAIEGEHFLWQAGAAAALARISRYADEERYAAVARQALLTLLLDTVTDARDPQLRHTVLPSALLNRLAAGGRLAPGARLTATGFFETGAFFAVTHIFAGEPADHLAPELIEDVVLATRAELAIPDVGGIGGESGGETFSILLHGQNDLRISIRTVAIGMDQ